MTIDTIVDLSGAEIRNDFGKTGTITVTSRMVRKCPP